MPGDDNEKNRKEQNRAFMTALSMLSQIGINIIVCVAIGLAIGYYLDRWLGTRPWLLILFIFIGVAAAFKSIFDMAKKG